nr:hypothetical protein CFP56_71256 [Quercus suber]
MDVHKSTPSFALSYRWLCIWDRMAGSDDARSSEFCFKRRSDDRDLVEVGRVTGRGYTWNVPQNTSCIAAHDNWHQLGPTANMAREEVPCSSQCCLVPTVEPQDFIRCSISMDGHSCYREHACSQHRAATIVIYTSLACTYRQGLLQLSIRSTLSNPSKSQPRLAPRLHL